MMTPEDYRAMKDVARIAGHEASAGRLGLALVLGLMVSVAIHGVASALYDVARAIRETKVAGPK